MFKLVLEKAEEPEIKLPTSDGSLKKQEFQRNIYFCFIGASLIAQLVKNLPPVQKTWLQSPGLGRSPRGGSGNPLQYSCLENPMDRGAWQATVHGVVRVKHDLATKPPPPPPQLY